MLKVNISVGANAIEIEGDMTFAEALPLVKDWFTAIKSIELDADKLREMTARLAKSTKALSDAEKADAGHP